MKNYKNKKNINNKDEYLLSSDKEITRNDQNYYLNKYRKIYGNSFNDIELLDIFAKNNYNDKQIMEDIKALLTIGTNKKYDNYIYNNYNSYESRHKSHKSSSKSRGKKNKYERRPFQKGIEIPSDYAPPPKKEEDEDNINEQNNGNKNNKKEINNIDKNNDNKIEIYINNNNNNENNKYKNDLLLTYKENLFKKLKNTDYSYKSSKSKNDELNADNILNNINNYQKKINLTDKNRNFKIENNSPGPQCQPYKKNKIEQNINKDLKKKYIREFFGNMKNYSNNIRRENWEKSPDLNRRDNVLDISPDKPELYERRVLTYKKGYKNNYSNENTYNYNNKKEYKSLKIVKNVNDFSIASCYDNPQRDQYLKIINEKKKQNPDKIIEFLIPQFPPMFPPMPQYQNYYTPYNHINPYMNMYMMSPPPQFPMQNPNPLMPNIPVQNINNNNNFGNNTLNNNSNNSVGNNETPENQNILTQTQIMQLNNNNQMNVKINNTPNPNALLLKNNNDMNNSKSNKSSGNVSNSGNNVVDANIHL